MLFGIPLLKETRLRDVRRLDLGGMALFFLDRERRTRDRALFDLAIDSKLRGCDLVKIRIRDVVAGPEIRTRAIVLQQKTGRPVQFEITSDVRASLLAWLERRGGTIEDYASRVGSITRTT